jgi:UDP:flavonoid glycosyltransferase YjiC (YdhE family)
MPDGLTWTELGPDFMAESPWLNLYLYPSIADYDRQRPLAPTWHRIESCVRATTEAWKLPAHLRPDAPGVAPDSGLVYLSLGSLGSADVALMQRLVDVMGSTRHRVIVSKGPLADQLVLHPNMTGEAFLPQPAILPQVDVVITHGGNNTVTEAFHHGKPMVVLPLFWDQVDNAQRLDETGFGVRLSTYGFDDADLPAAVDRLLADTALRARLAANAAALQASPGRVRAAELIERVALTGQPVAR